MINNPVFTISLDFELLWGVRDHRNIEGYGRNIIGAREAIPKLLKLFEKYSIHASWATVGFLFAEDKAELSTFAPINKPSYINPNYSPYLDLSVIGENENTDPYHFGFSLIQEIHRTPFQEVCSHIYSHYYCLENGQTIEEFDGDIQAAIKIASKRGIAMESIIFPRNQFSELYLERLRNCSIIAYRGNEMSWLYDARGREKESSIRRALRLLDSYLNISGDNINDLNELNYKKPLINVPSSRFLRPYTPKLALLERLKLNRIKKSMLAAAKQKKAFHLWWHPHNFGTYTDSNLSFLESVLEYYSVLNKEYNMTSLNMIEIAKKINE